MTLLFKDISEEERIKNQREKARQVREERAERREKIAVMRESTAERRRRKNTRE